MTRPPGPRSRPVSRRGAGHDDDPVVSTLMTRRLVGVTPDMPLPIALRLMASTDVRHLPVFDGPRCVGMVREIDLVRCGAHLPLTVPDGPALVVRDLVRPGRSVPATARRSEVARCMRDDAADAVLVVDRGRGPAARDHAAGPGHRPGAGR